MTQHTTLTISSIPLHRQLSLTIRCFVNFAGAARQVETAGAARHSCVAKVKMK